MFLCKTLPLWYSFPAWLLLCHIVGRWWFKWCCTSANTEKKSSSRANHKGWLSKSYCRSYGLNRSKDWCVQSEFDVWYFKVCRKSQRYASVKTDQLFPYIWCSWGGSFASDNVKRAKWGKIHVQPEAVKRRKVESGSRTKQQKGQILKHNPFKRKAGRAKRCRQFAENIRQNEPVSKKAGRTMSTKTRCYESEV